MSAAGARPPGPLRVGVVGTGRIGRLHAEVLASRVPGARLAAVSDAVAATAQEAAALLGVPAMGAEEMLARPDVEAVAICASTEAHVPLVVAAAEAGKAIFCEKPLSLDLAEVDRALATVHRCGAMLMVGFNRRFDPSHAAVRDAVASGDLGAPTLARITSRDPAPPSLNYARSSGGLFLDMTIHDFDMARYVVGSEVTEVYAAGAVRYQPELAGLGDVDTAVVCLRHENGCLTVIDNSRQAPYGYDQRVEVLGTEGMAASGNPPAHTAVVSDVTGSHAATLPYFFIERYTLSYLRQWEAFVRAAVSGSRPPVTGEDGRAALVLGLAAKRALDKGRPVAVAEVLTARAGMLPGAHR